MKMILQEDDGLVGKTISHYTILEKLGEGGMGVVYKAEDTKLDRVVALKFLPHHLTASETDKARFLQEAKAASAINHPNVCVIHDIQEYEGRQFIVMEYVEGKTLREIISENLPQFLNLREVLDYAIQIADGLKAAHDKGVIHRDVKSENIMVTPTGQIKVTDFGLAKLKGALRLTKTASTLGTIAYMSPEQVQAADVDDRSDIFSYGVVLYEMLTGQLPFRGEYESAIMYAILNEEPEPVQEYRSDMSSEFFRMLNCALEKRPDNRYQTMNDLLIDLKRVKRESDQWAQPPSAKISDKDKDRILTRPTKRHKSLRFVIPLLSIALMIFLLVTYFAVIRPSGQPAERITLVVADINNETGENELDALSEPLITSLEISRRLAVMTRSRIYDIARQMGRQNIQRIDEVFCRDVCKQANVKILVMPSIRKIGNRYSLDLKIEDIEKNEYLYTDSERFEKPETVFDKIDELAARTRKNLKETNREIQVSRQKVSEVVTANLTALHHYFKGENLYNRLKYVQAIDEYKKAITEDSTFALAHYRFLFATLHNWEWGEIDLQELVKNTYIMVNETAYKLPEREEYMLRSLFYLWENFSRTNNLRVGYDAAVEILKEMEKSYMDDKEMLCSLGQFVRNNQDAVAYLEKVLKMDPYFERAYVVLGQRYRWSGQKEKEKDVAEQLAKINPQAGLFQMADLYERQGDIEKAIEYHEQVLEIDSLATNSLNSLIRFYLDRKPHNEIVPLAIRFAYIVRREEHVRRLATYFATMGEFERGIATLIDALQKATASSPERVPVLRIGLANLLMYHEQYDQVEAVLLPMIEPAQSHQTRRWGYDRLYDYYLYVGRYRDALQAGDGIIKMHRIAPFSMGARIARGHMFKSCAMVWGWNDVVGAMDEAKKTFPNIENITWSEYWIRLFLVYLTLGDIEKAESIIKENLDQDYAKALLHCYKNECDQAEQIIKNHPIRDIYKIMALYELAKCHFRAGQLDKALTALNELRIYYDNTGGYRSAYLPKSFYLAGKIHQQRGETDLAIMNFKKLLDMWKNADEDLPELIDAKKQLAEMLPVHGL